MRVVIVDDEALARDRLRRLLEELTGCEVVGEAADGRQALTVVARETPDVVLLDIRMPEMDGLEAARHLMGLEAPPAVIFTTAYGDHALAAFETSAVDYLLKPIRRQRLEVALGRAVRPNRAQLAALRGGEAGVAMRSHICARFRGALELVPVAEILYFQADQKYVTVRHRGGSVLIEEPLKTLEEEFGGRFLRIHRNALVAVDAIAGLERDEQGHAWIRVREVEERIEVSRRHLAAVRQRLREL